jgi:hypothetical protein
VAFEQWTLHPIKLTTTTIEMCAQIYFPITSHNLKGKILKKEMALE